MLYIYISTYIHTSILIYIFTFILFLHLSIYIKNGEFTLVLHIAGQYHAFILPFLFSVFISTCLTVENLALISSIFTIDSIPLHAAKPPTTLSSSLPGPLRPGLGPCSATSYRCFLLSVLLLLLFSFNVRTIYYKN